MIGKSPVQSVGEEALRIMQRVGIDVRLRISNKRHYEIVVNPSHASPEVEEQHVKSFIHTLGHGLVQTDYELNRTVRVIAKTEQRGGNFHLVFVLPPKENARNLVSRALEKLKRR